MGTERLTRFLTTEPVSSHRLLSCPGVYPGQGLRA